MMMPCALRLAGAGMLLVATAARGDFNCNVGIEFYVDGPLRSCVLNGDHRLYASSGEPLTCADGAPARLNRDGTLSGCTLARPARLQGQDCPAGATVEFTAAGNLLRCKKNDPG